MEFILVVVVGIILVAVILKSTRPPIRTIAAPPLLESPPFACGDREWPNVQALMYDAGQAESLRKENLQLRRLLGAIAHEHPNLEVSEMAMMAHLESKFHTAENPLKRTTILMPIKS